MTQPNFTRRYPMRPPDYVVLCRGPRGTCSWVTNLCQVCALGNDEKCVNVVNPTLSHHCRKKKAQRWRKKISQIVWSTQTSIHSTGHRKFRNNVGRFRLNSQSQTICYLFVSQTVVKPVLFNVSHERTTIHDNVCTKTICAS